MPPVSRHPVLGVLDIGPSDTPRRKRRAMRANGTPSFVELQAATDFGVLVFAVEMVRSCSLDCRRNAARSGVSRGVGILYFQSHLPLRHTQRSPFQRQRPLDQYQGWLDRGRRGRTSRRGGGLGGRLRLCALAVNGKTKAASAAVSIHRLLCIRTPSTTQRLMRSSYPYPHRSLCRVPRRFHCFAKRTR